MRHVVVGNVSIGGVHTDAMVVQDFYTELNPSCGTSPKDAPPVIDNLTFRKLTASAYRDASSGETSSKARCGDFRGLDIDGHQGRLTNFTIEDTSCVNMNEKTPWTCSNVKGSTRNVSPPLTGGCETALPPVGLVQSDGDIGLSDVIIA